MNDHETFFYSFDQSQSTTQGIYGAWFCRPEDTFHLASRKFMDCEVFRSYYCSHILFSGVVNKCYVMSVKEYPKFKPVVCLLYYFHDRLIQNFYKMSVKVYHNLELLQMRCFFVLTEIMLFQACPHLLNFSFTIILILSYTSKINSFKTICFAQPNAFKKTFLTAIIVLI